MLQSRKQQVRVWLPLEKGYVGCHISQNKSHNSYFINLSETKDGGNYYVKQSWSRNKVKSEWVEIFEIQKYQVSPNGILKITPKFILYSFSLLPPNGPVDIYQGDCALEKGK